MSDNESTQSLPELFCRAHMIELDENDLLNRNRGFENHKIERRLSGMRR